MTSSHLAGLTWPDVEALEPAPLLLVPLGSTEQHGPHLPLDTDTRIAAVVAERVARARPGVVVAPALPVGSSGEHAGFPGTLSIGRAALELVVVELCRSADHFRGVVVVCGHGGNAEPLARAVATLRAEGRSVRAWHASVPGGDHHAGRTETSIMLAVDPAAVRLDRAEAGITAPLADVIDDLRRGGVISVAANGVLGDPAGATAEEGARLLDGLVADLGGVVDGFAHP
ncbi:MAG: mycofactocin biosynthesis peptidyl-dipeptidase MftE [Acidimicrobiales bacterium]|jgi:creatinine amidohydrolase|nr:mycofactocin biosynthesis peptidyl-dipeptidase MftE [Acidimicrobiales bacterium]